MAALAAGLHPVDLNDPERARIALRRAIDSLPSPEWQGVRTDTFDVPGPAGAPDVPVRVHRPEEGAAPAAVLDIHGGGFVCGEARDGDATNITLARELGVTVVSVDYRRAPEHRYPAALDDCAAALSWLAGPGAEKFGVGRGRIAVQGTSAGGGLCAALALRTRDNAGPAIAFHYLAIPELDDRIATPSSQSFVDTPMWTRRSVELSWDAYLGEGTRGTTAVPAEAAPARAKDLSGLPPAYVSVTAFDPLRDEGVAYALAMQEAGVPVELHLFPGTFHGSALFPAEISRREENERVAVLGKALGLPEKPV